MEGFFEFIKEQGVVGLAIGFILGGAVSDLVKSLIDNIINPIIGIFLNQVGGLTKASFTIWGANIKYGAFASTIINFAVIAAIVYFGVKQFKLDRLYKKKE